MKEYEVEKEWISEAGLKCVVLALCAGHRCGYVGIDKDNQFFGKDYNDKIDISEEQKEKILSSYVGERGLVSLIAFNGGEDFRADIVFDVHGGITYAGNGGGEYPVESDLWWIGYDCAHSGDSKDFSIMTKDFIEIYSDFNFGGTIKTLDYCIGECESLAGQLSSYSNRT